MEHLLEKCKDFISTNTYARRVTKHHSYDYENMMVNVDITKALKRTELANVDHSFNEILEKILTKVHEISDKFLLVNVSIPCFPVVYVSSEFTNFYRYDRNDVFLADARLKFMAGPKTEKRMMSQIKHTLATSHENTLDHILYTKDGIPISTTIGLLRFKSPDEFNKDSYFALTFNPFKSNVTKDLDVGFNQQFNVELGMKSLVAPILKSKDDIVMFERNVKRRWHKMMWNTMTKVFSGMRLLEDSTLRKSWDWFILLITVWALFSTPLQACFSKKPFYVYWIDIITDVALILDVILNIRTTYVNQDGLVIGDSRKMATHYFKGWFWLDFIPAWPWEIVYTILKNTTEKGAASAACTWLHILKVLRWLRIIKVAKKLDDFTKNGVLSLMLIILVFFLFGHVFACLWFVLGRVQYENMQTGWITYWFQENDYLDRSDSSFLLANEQGIQQDLYYASLYFIMTIFCTVGFGNIAPWNPQEQVFGIIVMLIGAFFYAIIFGSATNIIMRMGAQANRFLDQMSDLEHYMTVNKFPLDLRNRIEDYFYYHWYSSKGIEHSAMLESWPKTLKEDTSLFLHRILFMEWPVFNEASTGCRRALSSLVERNGYTPGDYVVHKEDCVSCVYFLVRGHVKILRDGDVIGILTKGDTFGEKWWPSSTSGKSNADIQAMTYAEIEVLNHSDLKDILVKFPDYWEMWDKKLEITYELAKCDDTNIFSELPDDLKIYIQDKRTPAYEDPTEDDKDDLSDAELLRDIQEKVNNLTSLIQ